MTMQNHPFSPLLSAALSKWKGALDRHEKQIVTACTEVLLPAGGAIAVSGLDAKVVETFEQLLANVPPMTRMLLRAMLQFVERSPWAYGYSPRPLSRLDLSQRHKVLERLMNSRFYLVRTAFLGLRTVLTVAYFRDENVMQALGATPNLDPFTQEKTP